MPARGVIRRDRKNHSNLRPKHKHTKNYLQHYWPYLPMLSLILIGLWYIRPASWKINSAHTLAYATDVTNQGLLTSTNEQRLKAGDNPLKLNTQLTSAAQTKAQDMVTRNYWSHNTPDGGPPWIFILNAGYQYQKAGENLAYGFPTVNDTITGWMNSPTHRANLLDSNFMDVGFGSANSDNFNNSGSVTVVVAMYGRPANAPPIVQSASDNNGFNSQQPVTKTIAPQKVSYLESITGGKLPWISSLVSFIVGAALATFMIKHSFHLRKALKNSERYLVSHPLFDVLLVGIIVIGLIVNTRLGAIL